MVNSFRRRRRSRVQTSYEPTRPTPPVVAATVPTGDPADTAVNAVGGGRLRAGAEERFDAFYAAHWQPLLVQTYAVCGDLAVAREATRHAFVDAWHHWSGAEWRGPADHVRSSAFARSQWRGRLRPLRRDADVDVEARRTLDALADLPAHTRKAVVLACLSEVELGDIARQIAETDDRTLELVDEGLRAVGATLGVRPDDVTGRLRALEPLTRAAAQPTAPDVRGLGVRRRRGWLVGGLAASIVVTLGFGALVYASPQDQEQERAAPALGPQVTEALLLKTAGLAPLGRPSNWSVDSTSDNTQGTGINTFCQTSRFADPQGLRAWVRTYDLDGDFQRQAVQTIELSRTPRQSAKAFRTVTGWFGGCSTSQLLASYDVQGLGDEAEIIKMRAQVPQPSSASTASDASPTNSPSSSPSSDAQPASGALSSYSVGVVRTGHIVTWTAFSTEGASNPSTDNLVSTLSNALKRVCTSGAAGSCATTPKVELNPPPPSGEQAGMLAVADLPPVPEITKPWAGTAAKNSTKSSTPDASATTCDETSMATAGASPAYARTFLIPGSKVPARFGLSETVGEFPGLPRAEGLLTQVTDRMAKCEKRDPGATISEEASQPDGPGDSAWHLWRLESEVSDKLTIAYWMGIARAGTNVAQVAFVPGDGKQDMSKAEFTALVVRARDRLFELDARGTTSPSASTSGSPSPSPSASSSTGG